MVDGFEGVSFVEGAANRCGFEVDGEVEGAGFLDAPF